MPAPPWYRRRRAVALGAGLLLLLVAAAAARVAVGRYTNERRVAAAIAGVLGLQSDTLVQIGSTRFHPFIGRFRIEGIHITIDSAVRGRRTRYQFTIGAIDLAGIEVRAWLRGARFMRTAVIEDFHLNAHLDRRAGGPPKGGDALLPHGVFRRIPNPFRIDTVRVTNGSIVYQEIAADGARPGVLTFDHASATATNVTNDPARMTDSTRAVIDIAMRIAEAGAVRAQFAYDLLAEDLTVAYHGTVGAMPARAFNAVLLDLEGIRITDGTLDAAGFAVDVRDDVARGALTLRYHDLGIALVDKVTHDQSLGDHLRTFLSSTFTIRHANPARPEDQVRTVSLAGRRPAQASLFRFVWETLREGLKETLGL